MVIYPVKCLGYINSAEVSCSPTFIYGSILKSSNKVCPEMLL